jgi:Tol biopolymer transport system component
MKRKIIPHLVTVIAVVTLLVLGLASASSGGGGFGGGKGKADAVEVTWDEGLTSGVTRLTNDNIQKNWVRVSPDGTKILYTELAGPTPLNSPTRWAVMYLRDANNPAKTPLVNEIAQSPSWYEDSSRFVYITVEGGVGRMVRSNVSGGGRTYISRTAIGGYDDTPAIKNGIIVFTTWNGNSYQIVTVKENGTEPTFIGEGRSPAWHPTEDKIVFIRNPRPDMNWSSGGNIYEMDTNSGQITMIYSDGDYRCYTPSFSPDGRRIMFAKEAVVRTTGTLSLGGNRSSGGSVSTEETRTHIFIMNADGTNVSPISSGNGWVSSPSWGQNGEVYCLVGPPTSGKAREIYKLRIRGE